MDDGLHRDQAKDAAGKWDIAAVPGGGGNMGGSYLTLPKQGKHAKEASELAKWLTAPGAAGEGLQGDRATSRRRPSLYNDPVITDFNNPFFNNAPVGKIFTDVGARR